MAAFLAGDLSSEEGARLEAHIDACPQCSLLFGTLGRTLVAGGPASAPASTAPFRIGERVGRYLIVDVLGEGGMGVVYAAHDPDLDRTVALKLLRAGAVDGRWDQAARLLREARAMARVEHPNVITVFDAGMHGRQIFIAMARVDGVTLGDWLESKRRPWEDVVRVFIEAGRGLAAAHAAGLVHRDFKPDNVLVGADGRVRVTDFGLARTPTEEDELVADEVDPSAPTLETKSGAVWGTPAYMAPEQYRVEPADARSDQFAFCVALHEALYGERPFEGDTIVQLREAVTRGHIKEEPRGSRVPSWLRRIVRTGLRVDPSERFASMDVLLAALARDRQRIWRRVALGTSIVAAIAAVTIDFVTSRGQPRACVGAERALASVWDAAEKQVVHDAFLATGAPYAADAWRETSLTLDNYAREWTAQSTEACEATQVRREQSDEMLSLRNDCLRRKLEQLRQLTDVFAHADSKAVEMATTAAHALPPLDGCKDTRALSSRARIPSDPIKRQKTAELRAKLARAAALEDAGKFPEGLALAEEATRGARELGYGAVLAEALLRRGDLEYESLKIAQAEPTLLEAVSVAEGAGHDEVGAEAWTLLVNVTAWLSHFEKEQWSEERAEAALTRIGEHGLLRVKLLLNISRMRMRQGKIAEAASMRREALEIAERVLGPDHPWTAQALLTFGYAEAVLGNTQDALPALQRSVALFEQVFGPEHPNTADALLRTGEILLRTGRYADGRAALERSRTINAKVHGSENVNVAECLRFISRGMVYQGAASEAVPLAERAVAIEEAALGAESPNVAYYRYDLGIALEANGQVARAKQVFVRAQTTIEAKLGAENPIVAGCLDHLGRMALAQGRTLEALADSQRALTIREKAFGAESTDVAVSLTSIGRAYLAGGQAARAVPPLERAVAIHDKKPGRPAEVGDALFTLARALWDSPPERPRAIDLARKSRVIYETDGAGSDPARKEADAWLARRDR